MGYKVKEVSTGKIITFPHAVDVREALGIIESDGKPRYEPIDEAVQKMQPIKNRVISSEEIEEEVAVKEKSSGRGRPKASQDEEKEQEKSE